MLAFDRLFDFDHSGKLEWPERALQLWTLNELSREESARGTGNFGMTGFTDNDDADVFADAGLDYEELEFMDPVERRDVLEQAGLDPDEFDF